MERDTSGYRKEVLPVAGPEVMTPPKLDKNGNQVQPARFPRTRRSSEEVQSIANYHWSGSNQ